jgi:hypothetical protein
MFCVTNSLGFTAGVQYTKHLSENPLDVCHVPGTNKVVFEPSNHTAEELD